MACLERKYEDPIFPTHKILGPECSEFPNEVPERKSIKRNIEKEKKRKKQQKWLENEWVKYFDNTLFLFGP